MDNFGHEMTSNTSQKSTVKFWVNSYKERAGLGWDL